MLVMALKAAVAATCTCSSGQTKPVRRRRRIRSKSISRTLREAVEKGRREEAVEKGRPQRGPAHYRDTIDPIFLQAPEIISDE